MTPDVNSLVEGNAGLVKRIARKHFLSRLPDDDLEQCGLIGLWEAAEKWNGTGNFAAFARPCIYHNMLDYVRGLNAKKRQEYNFLDGEEDRTEDEQNDFDALELCAEFARVLLENTLEYIVLSQIALNGDICAVAGNLGLSVAEVRKVAKRAYNAVEKARE